MPRAQKGEVRNPKGRARGIKNKLTIERERLAMAAMRSAAKRKAMGQMLAREVLSEAMIVMWEMAKKAWKNQDEERAAEYTVRAADIASKLIGYESPKLQSVTVHRADPYAEMTEHQLWDELRQRARDIGLVMPETPVLIE
jgi:hypothetical protein